MDFHKDEEIMDMSLIIKQVCQQPGLMEVMQRGSGPERGPQGSGEKGRGGGKRGWWARNWGRGGARPQGFDYSVGDPIMLSKLFCTLLTFRSEMRL